MKDLLGLIAEKANCNYISDLPTNYKFLIKSEVIVGINNEDYSLNEWNDAVTYILKTQQKFNSVDEARSYLLKALK